MFPFVCFLFVVVVTPHGAAETSATDCEAVETSAIDRRAAKIFGDSLRSGGGLERQAVQQRRTVAVDHKTVAPLAMVKQPENCAQTW